MKKLACTICDWCQCILHWNGDDETSPFLKEEERDFCNDECKRSWWTYGNSPLRTYDGKLEEE